MATPFPPNRPPQDPARTETRAESRAVVRTEFDLEHDRTHFAAERTYASWMRTGLSIAAGGIAIVRLLPAPENHWYFALGIGGAFVLLGIGLITYGARQFTLTTRRLREGLHPNPTTPRAAWAITVGLAVLLLAVLAFLAAYPPGDERRAAAPDSTTAGAP